MPPAHPQGANVQLEILSETSIDFTADQSSFTLNFSDFTSGAMTNAVEVTYSTFPNIDFKARVGSYSKEGGNTELGAVSSDFITVGESETVLARKANSTGDGKLLRGQLETSYKAVARAPLTSGRHSQQLTITLTDV